MNTFCEHHKNSIKFGYRCFDRILLNGLIQPFQQPERVIGFFNAYREGLRRDFIFLHAANRGHADLGGRSTLMTCGNSSIL